MLSDTPQNLPLTPTNGISASTKLFSAQKPQKKISDLLIIGHRGASREAPENTLESFKLAWNQGADGIVPVWSLADHSFFKGFLSGFLEKIGAFSTKNPDRDRMIVKTLLTGEANWIIFPEGRMVKDKGTVAGVSFFDLHFGGRRPAHTGAANLALRTEFYRKRLNHLLTENPAEAERLMNMFQIENMMPILTETTWIVPINLTGGRS